MSEATRNAAGPARLRYQNATAALAMLGSSPEYRLRTERTRMAVATAT
jgi:hypothetical protein